MPSRNLRILQCHRWRPVPSRKFGCKSCPTPWPRRQLTMRKTKEDSLTDDMLNKNLNSEDVHDWAKWRQRSKAADPVWGQERRFYPRTLVGNHCTSSGQELWKMAIFSFNFWRVWPEVTRLVSLDLAQDLGVISSHSFKDFFFLCTLKVTYYALFYRT